MVEGDGKVLLAVGNSPDYGPTRIDKEYLCDAGVRAYENSAETEPAVRNNRLVKKLHAREDSAGSGLSIL
jgi:hypothetical protein